MPSKIPAASNSSTGSPAGFCCLIGSGNSGTSTILDAAEAALSSRWFSFSEPDFYGYDTSRGIVIEATAGERSRPLLYDERFGLHIRGETTAGVLRDELEDGDEPLLTARISVDATIESSCGLVCERAESPRPLSNRYRALVGLVRLARGGRPPPRIWRAISWASTTLTISSQ